MIKKLTYTTLLLIVFNNFLLAQQDSTNKNSIFLEFGGVAGHFSFNYERTIPINKKTGINIGLGFSPCLLNNSGFSPRLPMQIKFYYLLKRHSYDIGMALTPYIWYDNSKDLQYNIKQRQHAIWLQIGYKCLLKNSHFYFSLAFTPEFWDSAEKYDDKVELSFRPWGAIRLGYNFKKN